MSKQLLYEELRTLAMDATYDEIGDPLEHPASIVKLVNLGTASAFISTDGTTDMDIVPAGGFVLYDITTNTSQETGSIYIKKGTQFYAKSSVAGDIYLVVLYINRINALGQT